jgi:uncharacterized protein (DUF58 family)
VIKFIKSLYVTPRFFYALAILAALFLMSYWYNLLYGWLWIAVLGLCLLVLIEISMLFSKNGLKGERILPEKFSNSDLNPVLIRLKNSYGHKIEIAIVDELPVQFQKRDFFKTITINGNEKTTFQYEVLPVERGEYHFGNVNCFVSAFFNLVRKRYTFSQSQMVKVYPSFIQMKKYDFLAIDNRKSHFGLKKIRRIGHTMEFEQIKDYVRGDDARTVNWKATAKQGKLMANQFQDEKMQPIYSIIDSGRVMKMPFEGLKLVDYAINSTLAFSNIALKKKDKVGVINFSNKLRSLLPAQAKKTYLNTILEMLYNLDTQFLDSDYGVLQSLVRRKITQRSLLMLYTNFEHISSLQRQMPYLQAIAKKHVLVVIFFENSELKSLAETTASNTAEIVDQTIAQQFAFDKKVMLRALQSRGIQAILTSPKDLTVNTINKYLEIKARGLL